MIRFLIVFILLLNLTAEKVYSQRLGIPGIVNFSRQQYGAGTQNWSVSQADNGLLYFANNKGLLEFNGTKWYKYSDIGLVYRSLCNDGNRIYVGGYNFFGYYEAEASGIIKFHSLETLVPLNERDFDEIWKIHKTPYGIVFQSFRALFIYKENRVSVIKPRSQFHFSYFVNDILWVFDQKEGLMQIRGGKLRTVTGGSKFAGTEIWTLLPYNDDTIIIGTAKRGLFLYDGETVQNWSTPVNEHLIKYQLFAGLRLDNNHLVFGTVQNGLYITNIDGKIEFNINKNRGLQNNTILSLAADRSGNIWLGLDNGISMIEYNSPLTYLHDYFNLGSGYTSAFFESKLYLGTNQGLFYITLSDLENPHKQKGDFKLVEGTEGQVWSLKVVDNTLICGHNFGVFQINDNRARVVSVVPGGWNYIRVNDSSNLYLTGHYSGISVLKKEGSIWNYSHELKNFDQSAHYLEIDEDGIIWVSHDFKGVFKLQVDRDFNKVTNVQFFDNKNGLPVKYDNRVFKIDGKILIGTRRGFYSYNEKDNKFYPDSYYSALAGNSNEINYARSVDSGDLWLYINGQPGYINKYKTKKSELITLPFLPLLNQVLTSYGQVTEGKGGDAIIGIEGGFAHYSKSFKSLDQVRPVIYLSSLHSGDTSEGVFRYNSSEKDQKTVPRFRFKRNKVLLNFSAIPITTSGPIMRYKLEGFDRDWSDWNRIYSKEYTNLPSGHYTFCIMTKSAGDENNPVFKVRFIITPPWYRSIYAYILYFILSIMLFYSAYKYYLFRIEKVRNKLKEREKEKYLEREQKMREEALENEKEMIRLRNEHLKLEMLHKEKELANTTFNLIQKNEILGKIKTEMIRLKDSNDNESIRNDIGVFVKRLGKEIDNEKQWLLFNTHVEQVHEDFFRQLKERFPELTPRELSLCAYLRMNISSKEIATLMNISTRGVEISRYRIRKKMGLNRDENLTEYMLQI